MCAFSDHSEKLICHKGYGYWKIRYFVLISELYGRILSTKVILRKITITIQRISKILLDIYEIGVQNVGYIRSSPKRASSL